MEENRKSENEKDIVFSQAIKAGKRIYYIDVKKNRKDEMYLSITESKKIDERQWQHDIYLTEHRGAKIDDRIVMMAIQLLDIAIKQEHQIGSEYDKRASTSKAIEPEGKEQVAAAHDDDGAVDRHFAALRYYLDELIHSQRGQQQEKCS